MPYADYNNAIQVEFLCKGCREGKHGCAKLWRGLGLEIQCYCSCTVLRSITLAEEKQLEKGGRHQENIGVRGLGVQSEPATTSTLNQPATTAGGPTVER
jgi:hypothetical protein